MTRDRQRVRGRRATPWDGGPGLAWTASGICLACSVDLRHSTRPRADADADADADAWGGNNGIGSLVMVYPLWILDIRCPPERNHAWNLPCPVRVTWALDMGASVHVVKPSKGYAKRFPAAQHAYSLALGVFSGPSIPGSQRFAAQHVNLERRQLWW